MGAVLVATARRCEAQNLVPNHSFEEADTCWPFLGFYYPSDGPLEWYSAGGTVDYFQSCNGSGSDVGVPLNIMGHQIPQQGTSYAGVITYYDALSWREYLAVQLDTTMVVGQTYQASMYVNTAWGGTAEYPQAWMASNRIGMRFAVSEPGQWEWGDPVPAPTNFAQIYHQNIVTDTATWTLVSGAFVADSAYRYLVIGNHFDYALTDTVAIGTSINPPMAYMFVDNVCVSRGMDGCPIVATVQEPIAPAISVFPNPALNVLNIVGATEGGELKVMDALGKVVWSSEAISGGLVVNVSNWARGCYILCLRATSGLRSFKFVLTE